VATAPIALTYVYKPAWVANTFLWRAKEDSVFDVDPLKIQKLVYNMHGWYLATTGYPVVGERFEAWPAGPVLSSLYQKFKKYRWNKIDDLAIDIDPQTGESKALIVAPSDERFYEVFQAVWQRYKGFSGSQLSALTHAEGTPWSRARAEGRQYISDDEIRAHFIELAKA
jgi:uncharacterized phage-associated protein